MAGILRFSDNLRSFVYDSPGHKKVHNMEFITSFPQLFLLPKEG
jgi:hypothetical protein